MLKDETVIGVVGLGYVGLPLAVAFGKKYRTIGYDSAESKIESCAKSVDPSGELTGDALMAARYLEFTTAPNLLACADFIIVAVPTPVDEAHIPDLESLVSASVSVGRNMRPGAIVIYESTVYPGATEDVCIPILERESGLKWRKDFHVGYSPERVNPGDKIRTFETIVKVVSADNDTTLDLVAALYAKVISAGVYRAKSIKIAEAAKIIENTQRDLNIALMNELAIIFDRLEIDTMEVLETAGTKWNFMPFRPGLVGGHCIGVDPYYLTHKAETVGYHPQVILAGRRINDSMAEFIAQRTVKAMIQSGISIAGAKVIILGVTFKENCADIRNSKVFSLARELEEFGCIVSLHDPIADITAAHEYYGVELISWEKLPLADALIMAVPHSDYLSGPEEILFAKLNPGGVFVDVKSAFPQESVRRRGYKSWRL